MMRNILFLVTGMTPQIITETVWALACDPKLADDERWIPDEIHVLTTEHGSNLINSRLLDKGIFDKLKQDYPILSNIKFDKACISVIQRDNENLADLKTPLDNELAADLICQKVREFTQDDKVNLHVSIAGGRKTMGFYAGYALSLYGRSQDKMSHILVEPDFENVPDFYYPTPTDSKIVRNDGAELNAKNAKVWLANIPFVRLRQSLSKDSFVGNKSFTEIVNAINLANSELQVVINELDKAICIADKVCKLRPREFAFYLWFAKRKISGKSGVSRPIDGVPFDEADEYQAVYDSLGKNKAKKFEFNQDFFDQRNTYLKRDFKKVFGDDIANKIGIKSKGKKNALYECVLKPEQIVINEM